MKIVVMYCKRNLKTQQAKEFEKVIQDILRRTFTIGITYNLFTKPAYAATNGLDDAINRANSIGNTFWKLLIIVGYWIIAIYGGKDILREVTQGETKDVIKVATKYGIGFAALVMFLHILDLIKSFS
ncbi:hypothetical protein [Clostridium sp. ZS2-4]|uniref:hypothetical protein n=1 Tax=Clostridium sp. ZS2-4 TaxID=2987703 RepID=UPI00227B5BE4|nr:hypothetical protein [Clostridium sp. ZS2-4]MCY6355357.1 hypothetical protein [Clostridium sp. ZS2-4]